MLTCKIMSIQLATTSLLLTLLKTLQWCIWFCILHSLFQTTEASSKGSTKSRFSAGDTRKWALHPEGGEAGSLCCVQSRNGSGIESEGNGQESLYWSITFSLSIQGERLHKSEKGDDAWVPLIGTRHWIKKWILKNKKIWWCDV